MTRREVREYVAELVAISEHQTGANGRPRATARSEGASTPAGVVVDLDSRRVVVDLDTYRKGRGK